MNTNEFSLKDSHSIAASILSFILAFISITNFKLTVWWHYIVGILVVILTYTIFFILIKLITFFYSKYIKRANISSNLKVEINELETIIDDMFNIKLKYDSTISEEYKQILVKRMSIIYKKAINKINFIKEFSENKSIKHRFNKNDVELYKEYDECCKEIANFLKEVKK